MPRSTRNFADLVARIRCYAAVSRPYHQHSVPWLGLAVGAVATAYDARSAYKEYIGDADLERSSPILSDLIEMAHRAHES
jgi:hypothetical protein